MCPIALAGVEAGGSGGGNELNLSSLRFELVDIRLDTSYVTGGSTGIKSALQFSQIIVLIPVSHNGFQLEYLPDLDRLKVYQPTAPHTHTENTAAAYTQNAITSTAVAGQGSEVAAGTNLSSNVLRALVLGF